MIGGILAGTVLACAAVIPGCATVAISQPETPPAPTIAVCEPSDDGVVWQFYTDDDFGCDMVAGQTLGLTGVPGEDECADMGGTYSPYEDLDPDDGWDDSQYGDCLPVDF